jgi:hypothetical protein
MIRLRHRNYNLKLKNVTLAGGLFDTTEEADRDSKQETAFRYRLVLNTRIPSRRLCSGTVKPSSRGTRQETAFRYSPVQNTAEGINQETAFRYSPVLNTRTSSRRLPSSTAQSAIQGYQAGDCLQVRSSLQYRETKQETAFKYSPQFRDTKQETPSGTVQSST